MMLTTVLPPVHNHTLNDIWPGVPQMTTKDDLSNDDRVQLFNFVVNVIVDGLLCAFGYFGNMMTILVLHRDKVKTSNSVFLQALAVFDSCFLTYVMLYVVLRSVYPYTGHLEAYYDAGKYMVAYVLPLGWTSQTCTIWLVMIGAIDRYIIVTKPFKVATWCTPGKAKKVVVIMTVAAVLFNLPRWPHYYYVAFVNESASNSTFIAHTSFKVDLWDPDLYRKIYHISLTFIFLFIVPLTILVVLNIRLIKTVKKADKWRSQLSYRQNQDTTKTKSESSNVTVMMVVIITVFVICELPDFIASVIGAADFKWDPVIYRYFAPCKEAMLVFNSAINFYIYLVFHRRFRQTLGKMLGFKSPQTSHNNSTGNQTTLSASVIQDASRNASRGHVTGVSSPARNPAIHVSDIESTHASQTDPNIHTSVADQALHQHSHI